MKRCRPPRRRDQLVAGPQMQVIGVAEDDAGADFVEVARRHRLHRALRADRHEDRRLDRPVRGDELSAARGAVLMGEREHVHRQEASIIPPMTKLRVGVIYGGRSGEHEVSVASAASIIKHLDRTRYEPVPIRIEKDGRWTLPDAAADRDLRGGGDRRRAAAGRAAVRRDGARHGDAGVPRRRDAADDRPRRPSAPRLAPPSPRCALDVVFPVLHGPYGEDGTVQGLLELANVPYVGPGVLASAVGMDKAMMKILFEARGLPVTPWHAFVARRLGAPTRRGRPRLARARAAAVREAGQPGLERRHLEGEDAPTTLVPAIELALSFDRKVIVEAGVPDAARDRMRGARQRRAGGVDRRRDHPVARVLRLRGEVSRRGLEDHHPRRPHAGAAGRGAAAGDRGVPAIDGAGMSRVDFLLSRDHRARCC